MSTTTTTSTLGKRKATDDSIQSRAKKRNTSKKPIILYRPGENLFDMYKPGVFVKVFIPAKYILKQVIRADDGVVDEEDDDENLSEMDHKVYGTDIYTDTSDIIGACQHAGKLKIKELERLQSALKGVLVGVRIHKAQRNYTATFRNFIRSRSWTINLTETNNEEEDDNHRSSNSYTIESLKVLQDGVTPISTSEYVQNTGAHRWAHLYADAEQYRFLPNVTIVFNFANEPVLKYSLSSVADKGFDNSALLSTRLRNEVVYFEIGSDKHELSANEDHTFRWAIVNAELKYQSQDEFKKLQIPLATDQVKIIEQSLNWRDIEWGTDSVSLLKEKHVFSNIRNIQYFKRSVPIVNAQPVVTAETTQQQA